MCSHLYNRCIPVEFQKLLTSPESRAWFSKTQFPSTHVHWQPRVTLMTCADVYRTKIQNDKGMRVDSRPVFSYLGFRV